MPRALLISYEFPPIGGVGAQRPTQFAKQLPPAGWDVTVLTVDDPPASMRDDALLLELPASTHIRRVWSLEPTRAIQLMHRLKGVKRSPKPGAADMPDDRPGQPASRRAGYSGLPPWLICGVQALFVPDEKRLWRGPARREAFKAIADEGIRAIISSGPPNTAHLIARDVARRSGLPWIADFRDPWVGNYFFIPPTRLHAALQRRWEARVVRDASLVLVVSEPIAVDLRTRYAELSPDHFVVVPNGFDPDELPAATAVSAVPAAGPLCIGYLGAFQGDVNPDAFFAGLRIAIESDAVDRGDVHFTVIGPSADIALGAAAREGLSDLVDVTDFLPHGAALEEMSRAHVALLVLGPGKASRGILTGKLLEYLGLGKPVLALVPPGAAADLIAEAAAGIVVDPRDPNAVAVTIADMLASHARGTLPTPDPEVVRCYDRRSQMRTVAEILGRLVPEA